MHALTQGYVCGGGGGDDCSDEGGDCDEGW